MYHKIHALWSYHYLLGEGVVDIRMGAGHVFLANFKIHFWEARRLFFHVVEEG